MRHARTKVERDGRGVVTVRLARPEKNNAYDGEMIRELIEGVSALARDDTARVIVLRGEGRHFQAGADLGWIRSLRGMSLAENIAVSRRTTAAVHGLMTVGKPVVALVHGGCFGGGAGMAAAADVVIAEESAVFSITEARWGLIPDPIVPPLLARLGAGRLRRYALTCERFSARRAFEIGLVDEVCPEGGLDAAAAPVLDALLHCPPGALARTKRGILALAGLDRSPAELVALARPHAMKRLDEEAEEGLMSFLERRKPRWYRGA
jgi:methylglutaconyl-CoA hydratase